MRPIQTSKAFGSALRHARKSQGLSQAELAQRAGVGRPWLSELETGKRTAELGRALTVLAALDLAVTFVEVATTSESVVDLGQIVDDHGPGAHGPGAHCPEGVNQSVPLQLGHT
mgnify:CR=1 FL=1